MPHDGPAELPALGRSDADMRGTSMHWHWLRATTVRIAILVSVIALSATSSHADPRVADLVQAGKMRVGLFLPQYIKEPASGELKGVGAHVVSIDVVRALAARLGVEADLIGHTTPPEVVACLKASQCDLGIMGIDPTRATEAALSPAFIQFDFTHLVPAGSALRSVADAHRPGIRIAVVRNHASTLVLARLLKDAHFVEAATPEAALDLLRSG